MRYELYVFDFGDGFFDTVLFGGEACKDVGLGAVSERDECVCIVETDVGEEFGIARVAMDDLAFGTFSGQFASADLFIAVTHYETDNVVIYRMSPS